MLNGLGSDCGWKFKAICDVLINIVLYQYMVEGLVGLATAFPLRRQRLKLEMF
jgi:hypothetical protein